MEKCNNKYSMNISGLIQSDISINNQYIECGDTVMDMQTVCVTIII